MKKRKLFSICFIVSLVILAISLFDLSSPKKTATSYWYNPLPFPEKKPVQVTSENNLSYSELAVARLFHQLDSLIKRYKINPTVTQGYTLLKAAAAISEPLGDSLNILKRHTAKIIIPLVVLHPGKSYTGRWAAYQDISYAGGVFDYMVPVMAIYGGDSSASLSKLIRFLHECYLYFNYVHSSTDFNQDSSLVRLETEAYANIDGTILKAIGGQTYATCLNNEIDFLDTKITTESSTNTLFQYFRPYSPRLDSIFGKAKNLTEENSRSYLIGIQAVFELLDKRYKANSRIKKLSFLCHFLREAGAVKQDFSCSF